MSPRRSSRRLWKALFPLALTLVLGLGGVTFWIVSAVVHPPRQPYLITPEKFAIISPRGLKATEERWRNHDGTEARGWLLRGAAGAPAIVLLHSYGADRSWLFNLGVKINEETNDTVLWPDARGHGLNPSVSSTTFGTREAEDVSAALEYLRTLQTPQKRPLVGNRLGLYGVELGAYAALLAATRQTEATHISALALDSVPASPDELLRAAVKDRVGLDNQLVQWLALAGTRVWFFGQYQSTPSCAVAASLKETDVLLLSGEDAGYLRGSTEALAQCFPDRSRVQVDINLPMTGVHIASATGEQGENYYLRMMNFFDRAFHANAAGDGGQRP